MTGVLLAGVLYHYDVFFYWQGYCITMTGFLLAGVLYHYDGFFTGRGPVVDVLYHYDGTYWQGTVSLYQGF